MLSLVTAGAPEGGLSGGWQGAILSSRRLNVKKEIPIIYLFVAAASSSYRTSPHEARPGESSLIKMDPWVYLLCIIQPHSLVIIFHRWFLTACRIPVFLL